MVKTVYTCDCCKDMIVELPFPDDDPPENHMFRYWDVTFPDNPEWVMIAHFCGTCLLRIENVMSREIDKIRVELEAKHAAV